MPPKKGTKRKATAQSNGSPAANSAANSDAQFSPPDRATWPGWVEMESEPAFFNVMLKEMGVRGVKIQEVYSLDDEIMAFLPRPVHALIFLFRYKDADQAQQQNAADALQHVWFANQIPDFACATVALLNIVNNIKGLHMGKELRDFKAFTNDMDPLSRGDAIDGFDFVKRIHNSFARENDLLTADMHLKEKAAKAKKKQALAKAKETREAKKAGKTPLKETSANANSTPKRSAGRRARQSPKHSKTNSNSSSSLSDPPDSDPDFETLSKTKKPAEQGNTSRRRSERKPKPRQSEFAASAAAAAEVDDEEGFHFVAYMPVDGHVWKLDGLDSYPQDIGNFDTANGGDWMNVAQPALQKRMARYAEADIGFNLMAVVHDPLVKDREDLLLNVKELQAHEKKLDGVVEDWRELEGTEAKNDVIVGPSAEHDISQADVDAMDLPEGVAKKIEETEDLLKLVEMRKQAMCKQVQLRSAVRDALSSAKRDEEQAKHRRHDYGTFVKSWLGALAENELLSELLDGE